MVPGDFNEGILAVVVGGPHTRHRQAVTSVLSEMEVDYSFCDDIYAAVAELAGQYTLRPLVVISTLAEIAREGMQFFGICRTMGNVRCCCFADRNSPVEQGRIDHLTRQGGFVVDDVEQLQAVIELLIIDFDACCLNPRRKVFSGIDSDRRSLAVRTEAVLSRAELNALLGDN